MVTIESQWYSNETHSDQGPGEFLKYTIKQIVIGIF